MSEEALQEALKELERKIDDGEVQGIDRVISKITLFDSASSIKPLLCLLRDDALYDEGMYSLIHAAESFDDRTYTCELLDALPTMCRTSPAWASIVIMRVLNSDSAREQLTLQARNTNQGAKKSLAWLLEQINNESPSFLSKTVAPLIAAKG